MTEDDLEQIDTPFGSMWVYDDFMKKLLVHPYEQEVEYYLRQCVMSGAVVANIGANVGYFTRLMSELVGPDGIVHAVEPHPDNVTALRRNVDSNVVIYQCAAGMNNQLVRLYEHPDNTGEHSLIPLSNAERYVEVAMLKMEELLPPLDFVLIDAQGLDLEIMVGLGAHRPPVAIVEYWEEGSDYLQLTRDFTFSMYREMGYNVELMHDEVNVLLTDSRRVRVE